MWQENDIILVVFGNIVKFVADDFISQIDGIFVGRFFSQIYTNHILQKQQIKKSDSLSRIDPIWIGFNKHLLSIISWEVFAPSEHTTMIGNLVSLIFTGFLFWLYVNYWLMLNYLYFCINILFWLRF